MLDYARLIPLNIGSYRWGEGPYLRATNDFRLVSTQLPIVTFIDNSYSWEGSSATKESRSAYAASKAVWSEHHPLDLVGEVSLLAALG